MCSSDLERPESDVLCFSSPKTLITISLYFQSKTTNPLKTNRNKTEQRLSEGRERAEQVTAENKLQYIFHLVGSVNHRWIYKL